MEKTTTFNQKDIDTRIRILQHRLVCDGRWIIYFGLWNSVKTLMYIFLEENTLNTTLDIVISIIMILFFLYISYSCGRATLREGTGIRMKKRHLFLLSMFWLSSIATISVMVYFFISHRDNSVLTLSSSLLEVTSLILYSEVLFSIFTLRHLYKNRG